MKWFCMIDFLFNITKPPSNLVRVYFINNSRVDNFLEWSLQEVLRFIISRLRLDSGYLLCIAGKLSE